MVSACLTWNGATKSFFVNGCGVKVNAQTYKQHLQRELSPVVQRLYKHKNYFYTRQCTIILFKPRTRFFIRNTQFTFYQSTWMPPSSPDCNPLNYYFWNKVKEKVYENRLSKPFKSERELKKQLKVYWKILPSIYERLKDQSNSLLED